MGQQREHIRSWSTPVEQLEEFCLLLDQSP
jgi:hypothetical protein